MFVGRVLELAVVRRGADAGDVETVATFQVTRSWNGSEPTGHEYLVFAYGDTLTTTVCDTAEVAASSTTLKWLQRSPAGSWLLPKCGRRAAGQWSARG